METTTTSLGESEDALIREYDGYVQALARRLHRRLNRGADLDELVALGRVGLLQAVRRYQAGRGCSLKTFAHRRIEGAMLDGLRREHRQTRLDDVVRGVERNLAASRIQGAGAGEAGRAEVGETELAEAVDTVLTAHLLSLGVASHLEPRDTAENPEEALARREEHALLHGCLDSLDDRDGRLIRGYYFDGRTLSDLGSEYGLSKARMCRLLAAACRKLGQVARRAGITRER